jgi:hypothetical protein
MSIGAYVKRQENVGIWWPFNFGIDIAGLDCWR